VGSLAGSGAGFSVGSSTLTFYQNHLSFRVCHPLTFFLFFAGLDGEESTTSRRDLWDLFVEGGILSIADRLKTPLHLLENWIEVLNE
jgi:hypothetical protein